MYYTKTQLVTLYSFDFLSNSERLHCSKPYFTSSGWGSFATVFWN